jgi:signal transduction histidine kinase
MPQRTLLIIDGSADDRARILNHIISSDSTLTHRTLDAEAASKAVASMADAPPDQTVVLTASIADKSTAGSDATPSQAGERQSELERLYTEARANNDALRAADSAKDDFLALLSHQLRTPLTPVLSLVSSALNDPALPPDTQEAFAMIRRNVELAARLIDDLLDLSQITSGRLKIEKSPVDVHSCIEAALDVCHAGFDDKKIAVRTELAALHPVVIGEFARLNQALWNVFKNAAKFTGLYGNVTIATSNEPGRVIIEVRDDGMGIEAERVGSLFGPPGSIKPQPTPTGVGLGLAITRAIVDGHGGEIHAESDGRGRGSKFRISLPTIAAVLPSAEEPSRAASAAARGKTILVVEDHQDTLRVLSRVLRRKGFNVTTAGNVADACKQFENTPADLVICDIGLPDGTGWDLMEKLRPLGPVRAIAVSGYGMGLDVKKSSEVGFVSHLTKPIDFPKLESLIIEALAPPQS